jgi:hypothetical protein
MLIGENKTNRKGKIMKKRVWILATVIVVVGLATSGHLFSQMAPLTPPNDEDSDRPLISWELDENGGFAEDGLQLVSAAWDGLYEVTSVDGVYAVHGIPGDGGGANFYLYFKADGNTLHRPPKGTRITLKVEYYDDETGNINLQYRDWDTKSVIWTSTSWIKMGGALVWKTYEFSMENALFAQDFTSGSDFRLCLFKANAYVRKVEVFIEG